MKLFNQLFLVFFTLITIIIIGGCNSNQPGQNSSGGKIGSKTDSTANEIKPPDLETTQKAMAGTDAGAGTEITDTPIYAIWVSKKDNNKMYDGMYDSASAYFRLCESKQELHIDDRSEIAVNADKSCYSQGTALKMIIIKKGESGKPLFLMVLHVDSVGKNLVALTDNNDTIMTSAKTMNNAAFEKLKMQYHATPFNKVETDKIKQYYAPEMKVQNQQRKEQVMKMNVAVMKR